MGCLNSTIEEPAAANAKPQPAPSPPPAAAQPAAVVRAVPKPPASPVPKTVEAYAAPVTPIGDSVVSPTEVALFEEDKGRTAHALSKLRTDCKVRDLYRLAKTLGTGGFSIVKLAIEKSNNKEWACKIMALPPAGAAVGDNENTRDDIFKEIDILCNMDHDNVIYLNEYFEEGNKVYLITELLTGGELLDAVLKRGSYSEGEARLCFSQLLKGIEYLHSRNVVHRDLKLENLLLAAPDDISRIKIADFGLAKKAIEGTMQTICGTPQYVAPEVIMGTKNHIYGPGVDMWSAGVVLFVLLGGYPPFWSESEPQLFDQIRRGAFSFDDPVWDNISEGPKDMIRKLLLVDPTRRLTATEALKHFWMTSNDTSFAPLNATKKNMKRHFKRKFRAVVTTVIAMNRMGRIIESIRNGNLKKEKDATTDASRSADHKHYTEMSVAFDKRKEEDAAAEKAAAEARQRQAAEEISPEEMLAAVAAGKSHA